jgi:hypothetical protein
MGLTCSAADGITAEIMTSNYGGFSKAVTGEKFLDSNAYRLAFCVFVRHKRSDQRSGSAAREGTNSNDAYLC